MGNVWGGSPISQHIEIGDNNMITDESVISRDNSSYRLKVTRNVYDKIIISVFCKQRAEFPWRLRPIHTWDFAPGACSRGTLREQSSSVCTNDFMGILHPREQNFHPAKCSTIFNRLNIWEQAPGANWANLKTLPRVYWHVQNEPGHAPGAKPVVCIGP